MSFIKQPNNLPENSPKTLLSSGEDANVGTIRVKNINSFKASWAVQIGETGNEQSEIKLLSASSPSGTSLILAGSTTYDHPADTPVYAIKFDKIIFKRSTAGTAGTATALTSGTISIEPDHDYTQLEDSSGATTYTYKTQYLSSVLDEVSAESDWIVNEPSQYSLSEIRRKVRGRLFNSKFVLNEQIDDWINEWKDEMTNTAIAVNKDYNIGTTAVAFSDTATLGTITDKDFKTIRRAWYTENGSDYYKMTQLELVDISPNETFDVTHPYFYYHGDTVIGREPHTNSGTASIIYYKLNSNLSSDADELPNPMKGYSKSFVDYCVGMALQKDNKSGEADKFLSRAEIARLKFESEITPRRESSPEYPKLVTPISDDEAFIL